MQYGATLANGDENNLFSVTFTRRRHRMLLTPCGFYNLHPVSIFHSLPTGIEDKVGYVDRIDLFNNRLDLQNVIDIEWISPKI